MSVTLCGDGAISPFDYGRPRLVELDVDESGTPVATATSTCLVFDVPS